jgi:hypothetical protein
MGDVAPLALAGRVVHQRDELDEGVVLIGLDVAEQVRAGQLAAHMDAVIDAEDVLGRPSRSASITSAKMSLR